MQVLKLTLQTTSNIIRSQLRRLVKKFKRLAQTNNQIVVSLIKSIQVLSKQ